MGLGVRETRMWEGEGRIGRGNKKYFARFSDGWLPMVGCGLTSHSAIFQLYSDETVVQFPNLDLSGTQRHGQLRVFSVPRLPRHGHRDV